MNFTNGKPDIEPQQNEKLDIFLLIGQSNMQGVAPIESLDTLILKDVYLFNDKNKWEPARNLPGNGMNRYSTVKRRPIVLFGPAYTFGRKIAAYSGHKIGIVSNARGATRIEWWQKGYSGNNDFDLYEEAVKQAKTALVSSPGSKIKGILWHQGEADNNDGRSALYMERLEALVKDLRKDLGDSNIPFIVGEVGKWNNRGLNINPVIRNIESHITNSKWVSSKGLTSIAVAKNDAHFDNLSQRTFGGRYADKAATLIYNIDSEGVTLYSDFDFEGRSVLVNTGDYSAVDLEKMGILLKEISSAKIDNGYELILYSKNCDKVIVDDIASIEEYVPEYIRIKKSNYKSSYN
jgi:hypothetical protein